MLLAEKYIWRRCWREITTPRASSLVKYSQVNSYVLSKWLMLFCWCEVVCKYVEVFQVRLSLGAGWKPRCQGNFAKCVFSCGDAAWRYSEVCSLIFGRLAQFESESKEANERLMESLRRTTCVVVKLKAVRPFTSLYFYIFCSNFLSQGQVWSPSDEIAVFDWRLVFVLGPEWKMISVVWATYI